MADRITDAAEGDPVEVVRRLWDRIDARDWDGFGALLADDVVFEWPVTAEVFSGRRNVVAVQAEYPEGWEIHVLRIVGDGDQAVSEVEVPHATFGVSLAVSWWELLDGRVVRAREYWTSPGSEQAPPWRAPYADRPQPSEPPPPSAA